MVISSELAGPPVEWAGLPVSPTLPYLRVSKLCFMRPGIAFGDGRMDSSINSMGIKDVFKLPSNVFPSKLATPRSYVQ